MVLRATGQSVEVLADGSGKIRATRQTAHVLVDGAGKARVTGQVIEVLVNEPTGSEVNENVSQNVTFSQTATQTRARAGIASDTLAFTDLANAQATNGVEQTISFSDTATAAVDKHRSASQSLGLAQSVEIRGPVYVQVHHVLDLQQTDEGRPGVLNLGIEDTLRLEGRVSIVRSVSVSQTLTFTQSGARRFTGKDHDYYTLNIYDNILKSATFWAIRDANIWKLVEFTTPLKHLALEVFDCVTLDLPDVAPAPVKAVITAVKYDVARDMNGASPGLLPLNIVARRLRVPVRWLSAEAEAGRVPCLRAGNVFVCDPQAVEAALLERARQPVAVEGQRDG
jgi:hypothetical protein